MSGIFISYRRQDSDAYAGRLYDRLAAHFGEEQIFMDIDMQPGIDFVDEIEQRVALCEVLIAVIGRSWLEVKNDAGLDGWTIRGLEHLKIAAALKRKIPVIPTLVGGAKMPQASDLPNVLSKLTRRQAIEVSHAGFNADAGRLIRGLELLSPKEKEKAKGPVVPVIERSAGENRESQPKIEGVYLDPETGLMWTIDDNGKDVDWHEANEYAKQLRRAGYSDWRLPTIEELESFYDPKGGSKYNIRKPFRLTGYWVWSSTKEGSDSAWFFSRRRRARPLPPGRLQQRPGLVCASFRRMMGYLALRNGNCFSQTSTSQALPTGLTCSH